MKRRQFLQTFSAASLVLCGCGSEPVNSGSFQRPSHNDVSSPLIVSPQQAASLNGLRLAAASTVESQPVPLLGGALKVDVDALTTLTETSGALLALTSLQNFWAALGVQRDQPVIVYDDGEMKFGARVRFLLGYCGVLQPVLVDGGAPGLAGLLPLQAGSAIPSAFQADATSQPIALVFQQEALRAIQNKSGAKLIDVRTPAEFNGQLLLPGDARPGHIPGAQNLPEGDFLEGPRLRTPPEVTSLFTMAGLSPDDNIVVYCHDGAKSSLIATLLVENGFPATSLYYLSYRDWSQNQNLPVEL
ncbi:MAG: sulfurtransferase [Candidatus Eremiobacteraeota bacterium]|nr:sulfurtransferase [Candidatus Eremiobacteraeota bacterium]MCW5866131.1 sulfurtransferase [Candidatus Eremiobacteraeota bacterium]